MMLIVRRLLLLVATTLFAVGAWLAPGAGIGLADPYDDGDGTVVDVSPGVGADEPQQDAPEVQSPDPVDEPSPTEQPVAPPAPTEDDSGESPTDGDDANEISADHPSADPEDTKQALASTPAVAEVRQADDATVSEMRTTVETAISSSTSVQVTQWSSSWVRYDQYYRPLIANPFSVPIQLVYAYANSSYVVTIPPLAQSVLNVPQPGVYGFTAVVPTTSGGVSNVSVGSFSGGGYAPKPGQPPPPKPAPLVTYDDVLVSFDLAGVRYEPVTVKSVVDLGDDPTTGSRRVLLDAKTPAWGRWDQTSSGQREFTVTSTQSLPGLTAPAPTAPPGYALTAASPTTSDSATPSILVWVALALGVLAVVAVVVVVLIRRPRSSRS